MSSSPLPGACPAGGRWHPGWSGRHPPRQPRQTQQDTQAIRQWAWDHGYQASERSRIPTDVVTAYQDEGAQAWVRSR